MPAVSAELDRIDTYVDQALYYARSSSVDRDYVIRETSLETLVNDAVKAHARTLIERGVRISKGDLDETVLCDAKWMRFCLSQVIENAAKYPAAEGEGRVPEISFAARRERQGSADECVVLSIRDNGRGIPEQDLPRLFDKGFVGTNGRAHDAAKSTGIGLYLVKRLCDKMGLGIGVTSSPGRWTEVDFTFPMNRLHFLDDESRL
jgi:signal transduction histidine kinase